MKSITIFLYGGFGNNLSQVNFGSSLEEKNIQVKYCDILTKKNMFTHILGWKIHEQTHKNLNLTYVNYNFFKLLKIFSVLLISRILAKNVSNVFYEYNINSKEIDKLAAEKFKYFFGYFQSSIILKRGIKLQLFKEIRQLESIDQIAIHIRGGDYSSINRLNESYYKKSLKLISQSNSPIKVFTNDKKYAENILNLSDVYDYNFSGASPFDDFIEIARSRIIISGNSTFSIWSSICSDAVRIFMPKKKTNIMLQNFDLHELNKNIEYIEVD